MEEIQKALEDRSFLSPRQIIEYMGEQFTVYDKYLNWEAFYDIMIGVFGKELNPVSWGEMDKQRKELRKSGIYLGSFDGDDGFLDHDFGMPPGRHARFYLNAHDAEGRKEILEAIVSEFKRGFKIKTVGTTKNGFTRYDNTIMYVGINDSGKYFDFLKNLPEEHFDDEVPLLTKKIGKGVGYGVSARKCVMTVLGYPLNTKNMSFSSVHSIVLQRTFDKAIKDEIEDYDVITEVYKHALTGARFDSERPYLLAEMKDPFEVVGV